jgi:oxygen-independent coproporphyrinogen-3 oxidase
MIIIKCKNNSTLYSVYNLAKAFFPNQEIKQKIDKEQEPQLQLRLDGGSCFSVLPDEIPLEEEKEYLIKKTYDYLSQYTGKTLPWGILTGVRPTKLAVKILKSANKGEADDRKISKYESLEKILREKYYLSKEKARLAIEVASREKEVLAPLGLDNGFSLYVSIPFCPSICTYCSFGSGHLSKWQGRIDEYIEALCQEIVVAGKAAKESQNHYKELTTIYIGGGTPTTLTVKQFIRLFNTIKRSFSLDKVIEYTVEAGRPETITKDKLRLFKEVGVTRVSINPQSMNQRTLDRIGRNHLVTDVIEAFTLARQEGFDNINMDLIIGLPGEGLEEVAETLREVTMLRPDSLTIHTLATKRGSKVSNEHKEKLERVKAERKEVEIVNCKNAICEKDKYERDKYERENSINEMLNMCYYTARKMDLHPYYLYRQKNIAGNFENVGFAKVDKVGIYNILIIEELQTIIGVGVGATTKIILGDEQEIPLGEVDKIPLEQRTKKSKDRIHRWSNTKDIDKYIDKYIDKLY